MRQDGMKRLVKVGIAALVLAVSAIVYGPGLAERLCMEAHIRAVRKERYILPDDEILSLTFSYGPDTDGGPPIEAVSVTDEVRIGEFRAVVSENHGEFPHLCAPSAEHESFKT
jgi:hypothetical protein